jgi:hypothetical protein
MIGEQPEYPQTGSAMIADLEKLRTENLTRINVSKLDEWLPYTFVRNGGNVAATTVACEDFYVPTAGSTESGITEVASLDLNDPGATPKETAILGRADTVYGSSDTLYLAAHAWGGVGLRLPLVALVRRKHDPAIQVEDEELLRV